MSIKEQLAEALFKLNDCNWLDADPSDSDELAAAKREANQALTAYNNDKN